ncbi:MAG: universal stress protein [Kofleriaceae bacterium]
MKRILVALDDSERAPLVIDAASRLAELAGATLVLYQAIHVPAEVPSEVLVGHQSVEDVLVARAHGSLEALAGRVQSGRVEQIVTSLAIAWDGVCRTARERDVDLIVIGSHGYSGLDRVLGTTAAKVVNHADRNVLVVRTLL